MGRRNKRKRRKDPHKHFEMGAGKTETPYKGYIVERSQYVHRDSADPMKTRTSTLRTV